MVMIGILLALQVNNWNTQKQEAKELGGFLYNISQNVRSDLIEIRELKTYRDSTRMFSARIMGLVGKERISKEEFYTIWDWKYNPQKTVSFSPNQSGFDALKSSGYLGKLQRTELEYKLYRYYDLVAKLTTQQENLNGHLKHLSMRALENNIPQVLDVLRSDTDIYSPDFSKESKVILELLTHPIMIGMHRRNRDNQGVANLHEEILSVGEDLIQLCEKKIG